jgi:hypothetical protein
MPVLAPCPAEDSANCFWDAATRSNHQGSSFVDINGTLIYIPNPEPGFHITSVTYDCDDLTLAECQPAGLYEPDEPPATETPAPVETPIAETPIAAEPPQAPPTTETTQPVTSAPLSEGLAETGLDDLDPLTIILGTVLLAAGIAMVTLNRRIRKG